VLPRAAFLQQTNNTNIFGDALGDAASRVLNLISYSMTLKEFSSYKTTWLADDTDNEAQWCGSPVSDRPEHGVRHLDWETFVAE
jgi:hypothetical protein